MNKYRNQCIYKWRKGYDLNWKKITGFLSKSPKAACLFFSRDCNQFTYSGSGIYLSKEVYTDSVFKNEVDELGWISINIYSKTPEKGRQVLEEILAKSKAFEEKPFMQGMKVIPEKYFK
jgi:hypothetical protein